MALGTLNAGDSSVFLSDVPDLPAGLYAVTGVGIGETDAPVEPGNAGLMNVATAFLDYNGAGNGQLLILAAYPGDDHYTVAMQEVRAVQTGVFPLEISGFSTQDPNQVSGIPVDALAGLTPGLTYNITGNALTIGTTFSRPAAAPR